MCTIAGPLTGPLDPILPVQPQVVCWHEAGLYGGPLARPKHCHHWSNTCQITCWTSTSQVHTLYMIHWWRWYQRWTSRGAPQLLVWATVLGAFLTFLALTVRTLVCTWTHIPLYTNVCVIQMMCPISRDCSFSHTVTLCTAGGYPVVHVLVCWCGLAGGQVAGYGVVWEVCQ